MPATLPVSPTAAAQRRGHSRMVDPWLLTTLGAPAVRRPATRRAMDGRSLLAYAAVGSGANCCLAVLP